MSYCQGQAQELALWGVQEELIKHFCEGVTARSAAQIVGMNRNTAILHYSKGQDPRLGARKRIVGQRPRDCYD